MSSRAAEHELSKDKSEFYACLFSHDEQSAGAKWIFRFFFFLQNSSPGGEDLRKDDVSIDCFETLQARQSLLLFWLSLWLLFELCRTICIIIKKIHKIKPVQL